MTVPNLRQIAAQELARQAQEAEVAAQQRAERLAECSVEGAQAAERIKRRKALQPAITKIIRGLAVDTADTLAEHKVRPDRQIEEFRRAGLFGGRLLREVTQPFWLLDLSHQHKSHSHESYGATVTETTYKGRGLGLTEVGSIIVLENHSTVGPSDRNLQNRGEASDDRLIHPGAIDLTITDLTEQPGFQVWCSKLTNLVINSLQS